MRSLLLFGWLLLPVGAVAWHCGPGQERMLLDDVARLLAQAEQHAAKEHWSQAAQCYEEALRQLPPGRVAEQRRIRLELAKAQMLSSKLPDAHQGLQALVEEMRNDPGADQGLLAEARSAQANSQYYMTWLMRLEGQPKEAWEPEIEAARQTYKLLAEQTEAASDPAAARKHKEDLESAIRLARMDLSELQGLPLPSQ